MTAYTRDQVKLLLEELSKFRYASRNSVRVKKPSGYAEARRIIRGYETAVRREGDRLRREHERLYSAAHKAIIFGEPRKKIEILFARLRKGSR